MNDQLIQQLLSALVNLQASLDNQCNQAIGCTTDTQYQQSLSRYNDQSSFAAAQSLANANANAQAQHMQLMDLTAKITGGNRT